MKQNRQLNRRNLWKVFAGLALFTTVSLTSCEDETTTPPVDTEKVLKVVEGTLSGNITWSADTIYELRGFVRIGEDLTLAGPPTKTGILTIEKGTVIVGDRTTKGTLIIHRGSQIIAEGSASEPIIFTSERAPGLKAPGDWGGVVICGKATNNFAGGNAELEGSYGAFHGGSDDDDNSGILKYVRIEYAGVPINPNQEVNSLTMGSVGRGTTISYVQCSFGLDDAFEWFGGTVNCDHIIAFRCLDDDFDVDNGFRGNVQFGVGIKDPNLADQSGSNGFEVDNDGSGSANTPFTSATFSNMTVIGPKGNRDVNISLQFQNAMHLRRSNKIKIINSFFTGYPNGLYIDGANTVASAQGGDLVLKNNILTAIENWGGNGFGSTGTLFVNATVGIDAVDPTLGKQHPTNPRGKAYLTTDGVWDVKTWFETNNTFLPKWQDAGINAGIFEAGLPVFTLDGGAALLSGADFTGFSGLSSVAYRGAFGGTDWTGTWTEWNPASINYTE